MATYQVSFSTEYLSFCEEEGKQTTDFRMVQPILVKAICKKQAITLAQRVLIQVYNPTSWGIDNIKKLKK